MEERFCSKLTVGLLLINEDKILMMKRKNTGYMDGMYAFVAGHVEEGESLKQAMVREAKEEAGIDINEDDLEFICGIREKSHCRYINFFFKADKYSGIPQIMEKDKCEILEWIDINNIPENTIEAEKRAINNYFNKVPFDEYNF